MEQSENAIVHCELWSVDRTIYRVQRSMYEAEKEKERESLSIRLVKLGAVGFRSGVELTSISITIRQTLNLRRGNTDYNSRSRGAGIRANETYGRE